MTSCTAKDHGPSTANIEATLAHGAQGARSLNVFSLSSETKDSQTTSESTAAA
jgi:hypothetical protein